MTDEFTVEQIEEAIASALRDQNMPGAAGLIHLLAVKAPDRAQIVLDAIALFGGKS